ncbi:nucleotide-diphospho-sugar transferase, partial [Baffinella frigidus]
MVESTLFSRLGWAVFLALLVPAMQEDACPGGQCSGHDAHPGGMGVLSGGRAGGNVEMVSVVTPTRGKTRDWHPLLYACFKQQDYEPKELVVVDDAAEASPFFAALQDPAVRYILLNHSVPLGAKRNLLAQEARGAILAHFDDDDWYAPAYLSSMVAELRRTQASVVKLSGWFVYSCKLKFFGYFDPGETAVFGEVKSQGLDEGLKYSLFLDPRDPIVQTWVMGPSGAYDAQLRDETRYGFGFTYVYRRELAIEMEYNHSQTFGEDLQWIVRV